MARKQARALNADVGASASPQPRHKLLSEARPTRLRSGGGCQATTGTAQLQAAADAMHPQFTILQARDPCKVLAYASQCMKSAARLAAAAAGGKEAVGAPSPSWWPRASGFHSLRHAHDSSPFDRRAPVAGSRPRPANPCTAPFQSPAKQTRLQRLPLLLLNTQSTAPTSLDRRWPWVWGARHS